MVDKRRFRRIEKWFERADVAIVSEIHREEKRAEKAKSPEEFEEHKTKVDQLYIQLGNLAFRAAGVTAKHAARA